MLLNAKAILAGEPQIVFKPYPRGEGGLHLSQESECNRTTGVRTSLLRGRCPTIQLLRQQGFSLIPVLENQEIQYYFFLGFITDCKILRGDKNSVLMLI